MVLIGITQKNLLRTLWFLKITPGFIEDVGVSANIMGLGLEGAV
jgi:hypothetical protein